MRSRLIFLAVGAVAGGLLTYGAVWATDLRTDLVDSSGHGSVKVSATDVQSNLQFEAAELCVDGAQRVTITNVRPELSEGSYGAVTIKQFELSPSDNRPSSWSKLQPGATLDEKYVREGLTRQISVSCGPSFSDRRTLAVRLEVSAVPTGLQAVLIDYKVRGVTKTLRTNVAMALCSGDERPEEASESDDDNVLGRCYEEEN